MLFKNIRKPPLGVRDTLEESQLNRGRKVSFKKHWNWSNQAHVDFCYIEYLDARSILFNNVKILNL